GALAKEPGRRWPSCRAFVEALEVGVRAAAAAAHLGAVTSQEPGAMSVGELRQALAVSDPAAVLVSPRVLRRIVQAELQVPYLLTQVPHENCYFFDRQVLFRRSEERRVGKGW